MRKLLAVLLLAAAPAAAQIETTPPSSSGGSGAGGAFVTPQLGPLGCVNPAYSFTGAATSGLCAPLANQLRLQSQTPFGTQMSALTLTSLQNSLSHYDAGGNLTELLLDDNNWTLQADTTVGISGNSTAVSLGLPMRAGDGTSSAPAYAFTTQTNTGLYIASSRANFASGGNFLVRFENGVAVPSTLQFKFLSGTVEFNSPDTGLKRSAAGIVAVTDGGTTNLGQILTGGGSVTAPAVAIGTSTGTSTQNGFYSTGVNGVGFTRNGALGFTMGHVAGTEINLASSWNLTWSSGAATTSGDVGFKRAAAGVLGVTNASTTGGTLALGSDQQLRFSSTTDPAGSADVGFARAGGGVIKITNGSTGEGSIQASSAGSAGQAAYGFFGFAGSGMYYDTTANDAVILSKAGQPRQWITGDRTLTDNTATTVFLQNIATAEMYGFVIDYVITATNATPDYQVLVGTARISMQNKGGTETCGSITTTGESLAASTGTLVLNAITCDTSPANGVNVQFNADSSLSTPTVTIQLRIYRSGIGTGALTLS